MATASPAAVAAPELSKTARNRLARREQRRELLASVAERLSSPALAQLPLSAAPLSATRAAATFPAIVWSNMPPSLDLGGTFYTPQSLGWKITGKGNEKIATKISDPDEAARLEAQAAMKKRKSAHLANFATSSDGAVHERVLRKRLQVESFAVVLHALSEALRTSAGCDGARQGGDAPLTIVDFGCAAGSLTLPLAHLFPQFRFVGVDISQFSLNLLAEKARAARLQNVFTSCCMIERYSGPLDVALALHACGCATDYSLLQAQTRGRAFIVSPCCIGKLRFSASGDGNSMGVSKREWQYLQTGGVGVIGSVAEMRAHQGDSASTIVPTEADAASIASALAQPLPDFEASLSHPRSAWLRAVVDGDMFSSIASVADTGGADASGSLDGDDAATASLSSLSSLSSPTTAFRVTSHLVPPGMARACKLRVEQDRAQAAREAGWCAYQLLLLQPDAQIFNKQDMICGVRASDAVLAPALAAALAARE